eukprot:420638_1
MINPCGCMMRVAIRFIKVKLQGGLGLIILNKKLEIGGFPPSSQFYPTRSKGIQVDGVFVDSIRSQFGRKLSAERAQQYKEGIYALLAAARQGSKKLNENMFVLANGMHFHCHPIEVCADMAHVMDGTSIEHFA